MATPHAAADRLEFVPPRPLGLPGALGLAILVHVSLFLGLATGLSWEREAEITILQVKLWATLPEQAAPKAVEASPVVQTPTVPMSSSQQAVEAELVIERDKQRAQELRAERDRQVLEQQQRKEQKERELHEQKKNCRSLEEVNKDTDQMGNTGESDGRVPCEQG